jgi:hypothetical protein
MGLTVDDFEQEVFLIEIVTQCRTALWANRLMVEEIVHRNHEEFACIQLFLTAQANIANVLCPRPLPRKKDPDFEERCRNRGYELCQMLEVDSINDLVDREVRNSYMHADERLQDWIENKSQLHARIIDYASFEDGYVDSSEYMPKPMQHFLHWYARVPGVVGFADFHMELSKYVPALKQLEMKARALLPVRNSLYRAIEASP